MIIDAGACLGIDWSPNETRSQVVPPVASGLKIRLEVICKSSCVLLLMLVSLMAGGMVGNLHARESDALVALRNIAHQQGLTDSSYVSQVVALIQATVAEYLSTPKGKSNPNYQSTKSSIISLLKP